MQRSSARQSTRLFEANFLKYLSIYDGVVRDTIDERDIDLASAVFEDQIKLIPLSDTDNNDDSSTDNTKVVGMDELKLMMKGYLQAGTTFELLEVHHLKSCKNQKRGNVVDSDDTVASSSTSSSPEAATVRIQYSVRMIKANGDSEFGTTRVMLSDTGRIASVIDTPSKVQSKEETTINNNSNGIIEFRIVGCFGRTSSKAPASLLRTPVFQSL